MSYAEFCTRVVVISFGRRGRFAVSLARSGQGLWALVAGKEIDTPTALRRHHRDFPSAPFAARTPRSRWPPFGRLCNMTKDNDGRLCVIANLSTNHEGNASLASEMIETACVSHIYNVVYNYYNSRTTIDSCAARSNIISEKPKKKNKFVRIEFSFRSPSIGVGGGG